MGQLGLSPEVLPTCKKKQKKTHTKGKVSAHEPEFIKPGICFAMVTEFDISLLVEVSLIVWRSDVFPISFSFSEIFASFADICNVKKKKKNRNEIPRIKLKSWYPYIFPNLIYQMTILRSDFLAEKKIYRQ